MITSNSGSLPEVVGDAGLLFHPEDEQGVARGDRETVSEPEHEVVLVEGAAPGRGSRRTCGRRRRWRAMGSEGGAEIGSVGVGQPCDCLALPLRVERPGWGSPGY